MRSLTLCLFSFLPCLVTAQNLCPKDIAARASKAVGYIDTGKAERFLMLGRLIGLGAVSERLNNRQMGVAAFAVAKLVADAGLQPELITIGDSNPFVCASYSAGADRPTIFLYAHYDVKDFDPEQWSTIPVVATRARGKIFGRGATDNFSGIVTYLQAIKAFLSTGDGKLPVNIKLVIEGEEEIGSPHMEAFLDGYSDKWMADVSLVADAGSLKEGVPGISSSTRGISAYTVSLSARAGEKAGLLTPSLAMAKALASLHSDQGTLIIPAFDHRGPRRPRLDEERRALATMSMTSTEFAQQAGLLEGVFPLGWPMTPFEFAGVHPAVALGGFFPEAKTAFLPKLAKASVRLAGVGHVLNAKQILQEHFSKHNPWKLHLTSEVTIEGNDLDVHLTVSGLKEDVHSGVFGGPVANGHFAIAKLIASLVDDDGRSRLPTIQPSEIAINFENPAAVSASLNFRTIRDVVTDGVATLALGNFFEEHPALKDRFHIDVKEVRASRPWFGHVNDDSTQAMARILQHAFRGIETQQIPDGGTIPLLGMIQDRNPRAPLIPYGSYVPSSNLHAPNENVDEATLAQNTLATVLFFQYQGDKTVK